MRRSVNSWRVVRPGPVPRETHPRNLRPGAAGLDWASWVCASKVPLCAASATPPVRTPLRDTPESLGSIGTSVSLAARNGTEPYQYQAAIRGLALLAHHRSEEHDHEQSAGDSPWIRSQQLLCLARVRRVRHSSASQNGRGAECAD